MKKHRNQAFLLGIFVSMFFITACELPRQIGGQPKYIDANSCHEKAQMMIAEENLSPVHKCEVEELKYGEGTAYLVLISYGPGMDCPAGCIYEQEAVIVFDNDSVHPWNTRDFSSYDHVREYIWKQLKLPVNDMTGIISRSVVEKDGVLAIKYVFSKYVQGDIYSFEKKGVTGNISVKGMSVDQAKAIAIAELEKKGYAPQGPEIIPDPVIVNYIPNKNCWNMNVVAQPKEHKDYDKCSVMVCLEGQTTVSCN